MGSDRPRERARPREHEHHEYAHDYASDRTRQAHPPASHRDNVHSARDDDDSEPPVQPPTHHFSGFKYIGGRKRALCIGIDYPGTSHALLGCVNDAWHMRAFLIEYYHFKESDIMVLTDDLSSDRWHPTREHIFAAIRWLTRDAQSNDRLFFHYSGHGAQVADPKSNEKDGKDEIIFPLDFKQNGYIADYELHSAMVHPLPPGCQLTAVFDSCHSGTILDLPFNFHCDGRMKRGHMSESALARKCEASRANVVCFSGSMDSGTSMDTVKKGINVGAMSYAFVRSLKEEPDQTFEGLLKVVRRRLRDKYAQKPQLSASYRVPMSEKFVI